MAVRKRRDDETADLYDTIGDGLMTPRHLSVGDTLRGRRVECALDIDHIGHVLRIRPSILSAIEDGNFDELPGHAYAIGFIRSYASYLGLDAEALLVRFKAETSDVARKPHLYFPLPVRDSRVPTGPLLIICLLLAVLTYAGWYYVSRPGPIAEQVPAVPERLQRAASPEPAPGPVATTAPPPSADQTQPAASSAPAPATPAPAPAVGAAPTTETVTAGDGVPPVESRPGAASVAAAVPALPDLAQPAVSGEAAKPPATGSYGVADSDAHVVLKANADSWIQVRDKGGNLLFTRVLKAGERYNAPNQPGLTLTAGNAGGLDIAVDGVDIPRIGEPGRVARNVSLDPDRLRSAARPVN